jgi:hypothetical protein
MVKIFLAQCHSHASSSFLPDKELKYLKRFISISFKNLTNLAAKYFTLKVKLLDKAYSFPETFYSTLNF